jgi:hypothetical protein
VEYQARQKKDIQKRNDSMCGQQIGRLLVVQRAEDLHKNNRVYDRWHCRCNCGNTKVALGLLLRRGATRSCGCLFQENFNNIRASRLQMSKERAQARADSVMEQDTPKKRRKRQPYKTITDRRADGRSLHPLYQTWASYRKRGICTAWRNNFYCFLRDVGEPPEPHYRLRRLNRDGQWQPDNIEWYDPEERNTPLYRTWSELRWSCFRAGHSPTKKYAKDGIRFHQPWADSFHEFLQAVGHRPGEGYCLSRLDKTGHWEPGNVEWTKTRGNNAKLTHNLVGARYDRGIVLARDSGPQPKGTGPKWLVRCDCGAEYVAGTSNLISGRTKSCGCLKKEYYERGKAGSQRSTNEAV